MDLSIVIVTWNSQGHISRCGASIPQAVKGLKAEVIVVDNGSTDGTVQEVRDRFPAFKLVCLGRNTGFAHACNVGIAASAGRYTAFLNPDAEVLGSAFTHLVNFMDRHPRAGVVGGKIFNADHTVQVSTHVFPTPFIALAVACKLHHLPFLSRSLRGGFETDQAPRNAMEVDYVKGAFFVARRTMLDEVGGFDERYFLWFDEVDLQKTAYARGWQTWYYPKAQALHGGGKSFARRDNYRNQKQFLKSMTRYLRKWHGVRGALPVGMVTPFVLACYQIMFGRKEKNN